MIKLYPCWLENGATSFHLNTNVLLFKRLMWCISLHTEVYISITAHEIHWEKSQAMFPILWVFSESVHSSLCHTLLRARGCYSGCWWKRSLRYTAKTAEAPDLRSLHPFWAQGGQTRNGCHSLWYCYSWCIAMRRACLHPKFSLKSWISQLGGSLVLLLFIMDKRNLSSIWTVSGKSQMRNAVVDGVFFYALSFVMGSTARLFLFPYVYLHGLSNHRPDTLHCMDCYDKLFGVN